MENDHKYATKSEVFIMALAIFIFVVWCEYMTGNELQKIRDQNKNQQIQEQQKDPITIPRK